MYILLGLVNSIYNALIQKFPDASELPKSLGLVKEIMHGGIFNGNSSRLLLKKVDLLLDYCPRRSQRAIVKPFYDVFKALDLVVSSCFGSELKPNYLQRIHDFSNKYEKAGISLTSKYHILTQHIPEFIGMTQSPLGEYAEQSNEAPNANFDVIWSKFKLRDTSKDKAGERLFQAVVEYNGIHV